MLLLWAPAGSSNPFPYLIKTAPLMHADYKKLSVLKQQFPDTPLLALTATATEQVARDLCEILRMQGCERFAASIDRPCLIYEVRRKPSTPDAAASAIIEWLQEHAPERTSCGIVYCLTRKARWWRVMARSLADSKQVVCTGRAARVCVCVWRACLPEPGGSPSS